MKKYFCVSLLVCGCAAFQACAADSAQIRFTMEVPTPTCHVNVESTRDLGTLEQGRQEHPDIPLNVSCTGEVKHALTVQPVAANVLQSDNRRLSVPMNGNAPSKSGPFLWLEQDGMIVKLTGKVSDAICKEVGSSQTCNVTPVTKLQENSAIGDGAVAVRFNVVYP
ncbi:hypothetical protein AB8K23_004348 [Escherichia coli]|uniref:hypothetical protein n=1 Tax=Escherichia coli TaxID=562 RepID=UPI0007A5E974|nr:hypothetical protein [Escherichia coli]EFE1056873.1 hypothetical protein [Escherichia coli]EJH8569893.1 hypothetical protein [Escherichia coli]MEC5283313.1 hypothetical protein [Escherichia coli]